MNKSKPNPILGCLDELFALIADIQMNVSNEAYHLDELRQRVISSFHRFERQAIEQCIENDQIYKCKYALAACIDEWVTRSAAGQCSSWLSHPLQLELFNDSHAGERFFHFLNELRLQAEKYIDVLEIYYLCLDLGYEGHYRLVDNLALQTLKHDLLSQIQVLRKVKDLNLSDEPLKAHEQLRPFESNKPLKKAAWAAGAFLILVSVSLWITMSVKANTYRKDILKHQYQLTRHYR